jgi:hypothetical protein
MLSARQPWFRNLKSMPVLSPKQSSWTGRKKCPLVGLIDCSNSVALFVMAHSPAVAAVGYFSGG